MRKLYCNIRARKFIRLADLILIFSIVAIFALTAFTFAPSGKGGQVEIYRGTKLIYIMPLDSDGSYRYEHDGHYNQILVENGKVSISESDCDDKLCVKNNPISIAGSFIACLPHELFVAVIGTDESVDYVVKLDLYHKRLF